MEDLDDDLKTCQHSEKVASEPDVLNALDSGAELLSQGPVSKAEALGVLERIHKLGLTGLVEAQAKLEAQEIQLSQIRSILGRLTAPELAVSEILTVMQEDIDHFPKSIARENVALRMQVRAALKALGKDGMHPDDAISQAVSILNRDP